MNEISKFILTDVDGVLLDWCAGFQSWLETHTNLNPEGNLEDFKNIETWLGLDYEDVKPIMNHFNRDLDGFGNLKPFRNSDMWVKKIHDELGYSFGAISACFKDEATVRARENNLKRYFGDAIETVQCVDIRDSKKTILARYRPTIWVEDNAKQAQYGIDVGHKVFLIDRPYNRDQEINATRIDSWEKIYNCLKDGECQLGWYA